MTQIALILIKQNSLDSRFTVIGVAHASTDCSKGSSELSGLYEKVMRDKEWIMEHAPGAQDSSCRWSSSSGSVTEEPTKVDKE